MAPIRLAHVWSADLGLALSLPHLEPLVARGWEVFGICPPGPRVAAIERAGVRWLPHPIERKMNPATDLAGVRSLFRTFREHRFHIVHGHNAKTGILARVVARAAGVPVVVHTHNGLIYALDTPRAKRMAATVLERVAHEACDCAFVQSNDDYEALVRTGGARPKSLRLIGNGIDLRRFDEARVGPEARSRVRRELGVRAADILFFSAGRIVCEKGFVELFDAFSEAKQQDDRVLLAIAGPSDLDRGLGIDAEKLASAERSGVMLLGERGDMPELFAASDVVVLPSWREGIPRVLIEGAAMGKPLIASDGRGCRDVVLPGWGLTHRMKDTRSLAQAMLTLAKDGEMRREVGAHNAVAAREKYDLARVLAHIDATYAELLARKGIRVPRGAFPET